MLDAVEDLEKGLSTSDLGGNLYKVRVKGSNRGKRSGFRTIVVYKEKDRAIFLYGFGKNEKANIDTSELQYFKKLGSDLLALDSQQLKRFMVRKMLLDLEVKE